MDFDFGNVAHNNRGPGIRFWGNGPKAHVVANTVSYRNGEAGIFSGAYRHAVRFANVLLIDNGIAQHASSADHEIDGGPARYERIVIEAATGPAVLAQGRNLPATQYTEFIDCTLAAGPGAPKVLVGRGADGNTFFGRFVRWGLTPDDIQFRIGEPGVEGTVVLIEDAVGTRWRVTVVNGKKVVHGM